MTEELKQKAEDFIDSINKESGCNWLAKHYLTDLLVMFATETTKELQEENKLLNDELDKKDNELQVKARTNKSLSARLTKAKERIKELKNALKKIAETVIDYRYLPDSRLNIIGGVCEDVLKE